MNTHSEGRLVLFGAGNIGRSFIGQLFAHSGFEVVFVDVDAALVDRINRLGRYRVIVKSSDIPDEEITVRNVRAVNGTDADAVDNEIAAARLIATAVGKGSLDAVIGSIGRGLAKRFARKGHETAARPVDIIIAENIRGGSAFFRAGLEKFIASDLLERRVGLVETSIGKMVPIMRPEDLEADPLSIFAEPYNTLIVDRTAFKGEVPAVDGMKPVGQIEAYVDRKLFVHNLGHAACAYHAFQENPSLVTIADAIGRPSIFEVTRSAMLQATRALRLEYPSTFAAEELSHHVDDLLHRFGNRALGDTIYRVGRDLPRKLGRDDRLVGAMLLAEKHGTAYDAIARTYVAALNFAASGPDGTLYPADREFRTNVLPRGLGAVMSGVSGLDPRIERDAAVRRTVAAWHERGSL